MKARCTILVVVVLGCFLAATAWGQVPMINFQGKLHDNAGNPLTGQYEITFRIYTQQTGGTALWTETISVDCENGLYSVILGQTNAINLDFDSQYWLGVQVAGDDELSPRYRLVSVPYTFRAQVADAAEQVSWSNVTDIPEGFEDGVDDVGAAGGVSQIAAGTAISVSNPTGPTATVAHAADASALPHAHHTKTTDASELVSGKLDNARLHIGHNNGIDADMVDGQHASDFVGKGEADCVTSHMIVDGTIEEADLGFSAGADNDWLVSGNDLYAGVSGNVGIGTTNPLSKLEVVGQLGTTAGLGTGSYGVYGYSGMDAAVYGEYYGGNYGFLASGSYGVYGKSNSGIGVYGRHNNTGNFGYLGTEDYGVYGEHSVGTYGALGTSEHGVTGHSDQFEGAGVYGYCAEYDGVLGISTSGQGVCGSSYYGYGVVGGSYSGDGVTGTSTMGDGVSGNSTSGSAVKGRTSGSGYAVYGQTTGSGSNHAGCFLIDHASNNNQAVYGRTSGTGHAGYFNGDVQINGDLSKSTGSFKIDHPLDPANKYLYHSFVESPDMMNVYNGNVILEENGEAWVDLPEWFEALNRDFRYQLTCIGGFARIYVAEEISNNRFKIGGGTPGMKVSWQVTGIRQDPYAKAHPIVVEKEKTLEERGLYLHPEVYGQSREKGIGWLQDPQVKSIESE